MALLTNPDGAAGILQSHWQPLASLHDDIVLIPQFVTRAQEMLPERSLERAYTTLLQYALYVHY